MTIPPNIIRNADIWLSTKEAAALLPYGVRWLQENKGKFSYRRKGSRTIEFELSTVLLFVSKHGGLKPEYN